MEKENKRLKKIVAEPLQNWLKRVGIESIRILPGSPWKNSCNESFNRKLRDELLNVELFNDLREASGLIEQWRRYFNTIRPPQDGRPS